MIKPKRERTCKQCGDKYRPMNTFQKSCFKTECLVAQGKSNKKTEHRKAVKKFKEEDKSHLMKIAQQVVNKYVRLRDRDEPCISCNTPSGYRQEAGHYKSAGGHARIRFNTLNIFSQCHRCNCHMSANLVPYRANLINKLGIEKVEWLESQKEPRKYTVEYLHRLIKVFKKKIKLIENKI